MTDEAARQRIVTDLGTTLLVEAAAGTGKTTMLVRRFVALLRAGADVAGLAAVTFTDKAAGELKVRIRGVIESERREASDAERAALGRALARLEEARISTLHTFAADLLRERPIEAGIDPRFVPSSDEDAQATFEEAFARWLEGVLERRAPAVERALARREVSVDRLRRAARDLVDHRHLGAPWRDRPWDGAAARGEALDRLHAFVALVEPSRSKTDPFKKALAPAAALAERAHRISDAEIEAELVTLAKNRDAKKPRWDRAKLARGVTRDEVKAVHAALYESLEAYARSADADLATRLRGELWGVIDIYEELKARRGILDFDDLLLRTRSLLAGDPEVRRRFAGRLTHLLVDEFQDTDPSQAAILLLLASDSPDAADPLSSPPAAGKLFCVGDPKQSIYRFRHADIATYARVKELVVSTGGAVLELGRSFRAVPGIQAFVNATFEPLLTGDAVSLQAAHVPLERVRGVIGDQPSVMGVPVPKPYGKNERLAKIALRASYPAALASLIAWLLRESGYRVAHKGGGTAPIAAGDICVLFRQMGGFGEGSVRELAAALTQRSIPFSVIGGSSASTGDEIRGVVAALAAIERPGDSLAVYAALRGFLFGISDESLFDYRVRYGALDPLVRPRTAIPRELSSVTSALVILGELYLRRNARPPAETVFELLARTRGHLSISLSANGEQTMTDLARIAHRAVAHERRGGLSFRAFIDELEESMVQGSSGEWDENATGVRIMTAHRAKGLEFPVVAIGDPASPAARAPDRVVDVREEVAALELAGLAPWELLERTELETQRLASEGIRLAYVAATRARDLLLVPYVGDDVRFPDDGWVAPLTAALAPRTPRTPKKVEPWARGDDSVVREMAIPMSAMTIAPGTHATAWGEATFFDPHALGDKPGGRGIVGESLLVPGAAPEVVNADAERLAALRLARAESIRVASEPTASAATVTAKARDWIDAAVPEVTLARSARAPGRPGGARFGTLVHQMLATAPLDVDRPALDRLARSLAALIGATEEEIAAASLAVERAMMHEVLVRAREVAARGGLRREVPVVLMLDDKSAVDGVVDLAFEEQEGWLVVDYKTDDPDRITAEHLDVYKKQVDLYRAAVERATGRSARAMLLFV